MAKKGDRVVGPHPKGGWQAKAPGAKRASVRADTQKAARRSASDQGLWDPHALNRTARAEPAELWCQTLPEGAVLRAMSRWSKALF